jgi:pimeloyl-ACP methyl ester carboxylesterase
MQLAHEIVGDGPVAIIVHGITESRETWRPLINPLSRHYTVIAVDLRGHGHSAPGDVYDPITMASDVRETVLAAGVAGVDEALVVGHSLGGIVVSAYGAMYPTRGIVNVDQPLRLSAFKEGLTQLEPLLKGDAESFAMAIGLVFGSMAGTLPAAEAARVEALRFADQSVVLGIWGTVFDSTPDELDAQVDALAGGITAPYLALHGMDPGEGYAAWLTGAVPSAAYELWPDVGHYPHLVHPDRFLDRLAAFDSAR